jgi:RNA polymerase sigma-70 factor (ECF subfamily)
MSKVALGFENIYEAFQPKIHRYLIHMVGEYEAEDLTQEVFMKVSQALENYRGEAGLSTWLYRIATNAALDRMRSPSFRWTVQNCLPDDLIENDELEIDDRNAWTGEKTPLVEPQIYRKEMNECILDFVMKLPESYRAVLVLSEFERLRNNEIAEILGLSMGTVKIRLHRAREKLQENLAANCDSSWIEENEFVPELKTEDLEYLKEKKRSFSEEIRR